MPLLPALRTKIQTDRQTDSREDRQTDAGRRTEADKHKWDQDKKVWKILLLLLSPLAIKRMKK